MASPILRLLIGYESVGELAAFASWWSRRWSRCRQWALGLFERAAVFHGRYRTFCRRSAASRRPRNFAERSRWFDFGL